MSARNALYAPAHRILAKAPPGQGAWAPDSAPSIDYGGSAVMDPRVPYNATYGANGARAIGWLSTGNPKVTSFTPATAAAANIAAAAHVVNGTAMTLVSATGSGVTVVPAGTIVFANYSAVIPTGALALDGLPGVIKINSKASAVFYDPTKALARCVSITGVTAGAGGNFLVSGADLYGYPMTQLMTVAAGANVVNSTKAFKFIYSVTPQFTDAHNYSVGTADIFGLNLAADDFSDVTIFWNGVLALTATFTGAVVTVPSTNLLGDVRGTFTPASGSDGTKTVQIYVRPSAARLTTFPMSTGLFGQPQV